MQRDIGGRRIGDGAAVFTIAEIGLNHDGSVDRALAMVDAAAAAGASAVKLQTITAAELVAESCPPPQHVKVASLRAFFARFELDAAAHRQVVARARERGLAALTTPFDVSMLPVLETMGFDGYKVASGDLTYDGLIAALAQTGRPLVLSTGMSSLLEVGHALRVVRAARGTTAAVLHCVSSYPTPLEDANVRAITTLRDLGVPVGLSDHGEGHLAAIAAVALGASVYERHLVLDGDDWAIDRAVSSTPAELRSLVAAMERTRVALGDGVKRCRPAEAGNVTASRRGLYARRALKAGEIVTAADVAALRPATDLAPGELAVLVGAVVPRDVAAGAPFERQDLPMRSAA